MLSCNLLASILEPVSLVSFSSQYYRISSWVHRSPSTKPRNLFSFIQCISAIEFLFSLYPVSQNHGKLSPNCTPAGPLDTLLSLPPHVILHVSYDLVRLVPPPPPSASECGCLNPRHQGRPTNPQTPPLKADPVITTTPKNTCPLPLLTQRPRHHQLHHHHH